MTEGTDERNTTRKSKFWTNELIWDELTSYLRLSDLKAISLVNKHFLEKVRATPRLIFKQTLKRNLKVHAPRLDKAIVEVGSIKENSLNDLGLKIFEKVSYLELHGYGGGISNEISGRVLKDILRHSKTLKSLILGEETFIFRNCEDFLSDSSVKENLSRLQEFQIGRGIYVKYHYKKLKNSSAHANDDANVFDNFHLFPNLNLKLKKFSYSEPLNSEFYDYTSLFDAQLILGSSLHSLVEIKLILDVTGLHRLRDLYMPKLMKCNFQIVGKDKGSSTSYDEYFAQNLIPFTKRHLKTLQEFFLAGKHIFNLQPFFDVFKNSNKIRGISFTLYAIFRKRHFHFQLKLPTLRSFELKCLDNYDLNSDSSDDEEAAWERGRRFPTFPSTITTIRLSGVNLLGVNPPPFQDTQGLEAFKNLTELSIGECFVYFNDETLQLISSQLTKLRILKCEFAPLTDLGISGLKDDGSHSGISLNNLKGLNTLVMSKPHYEFRSWEISWKGLLDAIQFLHLVEFQIQCPLEFLDITDIGSNDGENYLKLIQQNPSLETCTLKFYTPTAPIRQQALRIHSRLKY